MDPNSLLYKVGDIEIDAGAHYIRRENRTVPLRRQTMLVLLQLVRHRSRIVTKEELFAEVWGDVAVTDDVLTQCVKEIRRAMGDDRRRPQFIRTVPKVGYQFIAQVEESTGWLTPAAATMTVTEEEHEEVRSVSIDVETETGSEGPVGWIRSGRVWAWAAGLVAAAAIGFVAVERRATGPNVLAAAASGKRAIVVGPLVNQAERADLDWLREGLQRMLITNLARSSELTLLGREQLAALLKRNAGGPEPAPLLRLIEVAKSTGAQTVVAGAFSAVDRAIRVDVLAYDTQSARLLATEHVNVDEPDQLFDAVDRLSLRLIGQLGAHVNADARRSDTAQVLTPKIDAYRAYIIGLDQANALHFEAAIDQFKRAIAIDPEFAMAYARIGYTHVMVMGNPSAAKPFLVRALELGRRLTPVDRQMIEAWRTVANEDFGAAIEMYRAIVKANPDDSEAYWRLAHLLSGEERFDEAIATLEQALAIDPTSRDLLNDLCGILSDVGRHAAAIAACGRALAVAPTEPNVVDSLGLAYQAAGDLDRAIETYTKALSLDSDFRIAAAHRANAYLQRGQYRRAAQEYERYGAAGNGPLERRRAYEALAWTAMRQGQAKRAASYSAKYFAILGDAPLTPWIMQVALQARDGGFADAVGAIDHGQILMIGRGMRVSPRYLCVSQGLKELSAHRTDEALHWFRQAVSHRTLTWGIDPFDDILANTLLDVGRVDEAIAEYQRVLVRAPALIRTHYQLGTAYARKHELASSRREYERFLALWHDADRDAPEIVSARAWLDARQPNVSTE